MLFSSVTFLFCFLPLVLALYFWAKSTVLRNAILLLASLIFYAWGEGHLVLLMLVSCTLNYFTGLGISKFKKSNLPLAIGIVLNLLLLGYYKYFGFFTDSLNVILPESARLNIKAPILPIGISFFTFQGISYLVDVYRKESPVQKSWMNLSLYIALFPQLIAGPIVRYNTISAQISHRITNFSTFNAGIKRFIIGLGKKVIFANAMGEMADIIFDMPTSEVGLYMAWLGILAYSLQIYFDFSGYSDMAIGLGKVFGFDFLENFNFPYISRSIQEFWRRWHISLSTWFRDYLYIPLGGSRVSTPRIYGNLFIVFFTTGLWHGASWSFVFWGLFHGLFLIIERMGFSRILNKNALLGHAYTLLVVIFGWVFFRIENFSEALAYCQSMINVSEITQLGLHKLSISKKFITLFLLSIVFATPLPQKLWQRFTGRFHFAVFASARPYFANLIYAGIFMYCAMSVASGTYNPFIYFRF